MSNIHCPYCASRNIVKNGFQRETQLYKCKDCMKGFDEDYKTRTAAKTNNILCLHCSSTNLRKHGFLNGTRRYRCVDCNKRFYEDYQARAATRAAARISNVPCPSCNSKNFRKNGFQNGRRLHQCTDCNKIFYEDYQAKAAARISKIPCPHCNSRSLRKSGVSYGTQRYQCNDCNKSFSEDYQVKAAARISNIPCPHCNSKNLTKSGIRDGTQKYQCKDCGKRFYEDYQTRRFYQLQLSKPVKPETFCDDDDVWFIETLGIPLDEIDYRGTLNFSKIKQPWFKTLVKQHIKFEVRGGAVSGSIRTNLIVFIRFSEYLDTHVDIQCIEDLTREIVLDFFSVNSKGVSLRQHAKTVGELRKFIDNGNLNGWFKLPEHLIRSEDYPKFSKGTPNDIPKIVLDQIEGNLHKLPDSIARMWIVCFFCGMRISELQLCPLDCLKQDSRGNWSITFWRKKNKDYHTLPITRDIAKVIQQQQEYINQQLGNKFKYLFCARNVSSKKFIPVPKVVGRTTLSIAINYLIKNEDIKDENDKLWHFKNHQIRDSTATYLFESGHSFAVVSKWLGHKTALTTQKYIHVKDHTLRDETTKVQAKLTNIRGEALHLSDLPETLQKTPNAHTLAIPDDHINTPIYGYCGLPLDEECIQWKACYTCPSFVARREQLPDYIRIRDKLRVKQVKAEQNGELVKVDQFKQQADNLDAVIASFKEMSA